MQCAEFESRLNDLLDERLQFDADFLLAEHARRCRECRNLAAAYEAVAVGLEQSRPGVPGADLTAKVLTDVALASGPLPPVLPGNRLTPALPTPRSLFDVRFLRRRISIAAALAAAVLLAAALRWSAGPAAKQSARREQAGSPARKQIDNSLAAQRPTAPDARRRSSAKPAADRDRSPGGESFRGLAAETGQSFAVAMQLFPGVGAAPQQTSEKPANEPTSDWVHGLSDGLKPVTRPTAGAVNRFWQFLAAGEEGSRS